MNVQADSGNTTTPFGRSLERAGFRGHRGRAEFGVAIGVDAVTVWRWATGKNQPGSQPIRRAIAAELQVSERDVDEMFAASAEAA